MIEAQALIALVMKQRGYTSAAELARALKMTRYRAPDTVQNWIEGRAKPRYDPTLQLLAMAGLLRSADEADPRAAVVEAWVARIGGQGLEPADQQIPMILGRLEDVVTRLEAMAEPQGRRRPPPGGPPVS